MTWKIDKTIPTHAVPELELALEFYERLGFELSWRWPEESPTHAGLMRGECSVMLAECDPRVFAAVYFVVDDVEACHAAIMKAEPWVLAARAAERPGEDPPVRSRRAPDAPQPRPFGYKDFVIIDPWGHELSFGEVISDEATD